MPFFAIDLKSYFNSLNVNWNLKAVLFKFSSLIVNRFLFICAPAQFQYFSASTVVYRLDFQFVVLFVASTSWFPNVSAKFLNGRNLGTNRKWPNTWLRFSVQRKTRSTVLSTLRSVPAGTAIDAPGFTTSQPSARLSFFRFVNYYLRPQPKS